MSGVGAHIGRRAFTIGRNLDQNELLITLDALGTLYTFRKPIAKQYISIAKQCGVRVDCSENDLMKSFKVAFKDLNARQPNYGKAKEEYPTPREWWTALTTATFKGVLLKHDLPSSVAENLGLTLYNHFAGPEAYVLYDDTRQFLSRISKLGHQYTNNASPSIIVGVVSNSDPRVRSVLQGLGLKATIDIPQLESIFSQLEKGSPEIDKAIAELLYNESNLIDFVVTSYEAGHEKPDRRCWGAVELQASHVRAARNTLMSSIPTQMKTTLQNHPDDTTSTTSGPTLAENAGWTWIHIGDDYAKDVSGSAEAGIDAMYLDREGTSKHAPGDEITVIRNLSEAGQIIEELLRGK